MRHALIFALAAGREQDLLTQLAGVLSVEPGRVLRVTIGERSARWLYHVQARDVTGQVTSSGAAGAWDVIVLQPWDDMPASWARWLRDRLRDWASARQPTPQGRYHLLGPWAPASAPAAVMTALSEQGGWVTVWRAEATDAGRAEQLAATDGQLDQVEQESALTSANRANGGR